MQFLPNASFSPALYFSAFICVSAGRLLTSRAPKKCIIINITKAGTATIHLQLVVVVLVAWHFRLDTLALPHLDDDLTGLAGVVDGRATGQDLPVVEH